MIKSAFIAKTLLLSPSREHRSRESLFYKDHSEQKSSENMASLNVTPESIYSQASSNDREYRHRKT